LNRTDKRTREKNGKDYNSRNNNLAAINNNQFNSNKKEVDMLTNVEQEAHIVCCPIIGVALGMLSTTIAILTLLHFCYNLLSC
jgi:hypothetical protein